MLNNKNFQSSLSKVGEDKELNEDVIDDLEAFVCSIYGYPKMIDINHVRLHMLKKKCTDSEKLDPSRNVDFAALPPCKDTLLQHFKRTNYQVYIQKSAKKRHPDVPDLSLNGWKVANGEIEPVWTEQPILPGQLIDLFEEENSNEAAQEEDNEEEEAVTMDDDIQDEFNSEEEEF